MIKKYYMTGMICISLLVFPISIDSNLIKNDTLDVDAGGPYFGYANRSIQFFGNATGGMLPYHWYWKFGDGQTSSLKNPVNCYKKPGIFYAVLIVTESSEHYKEENDTAIVTVYNEDFLAPTINITKPKYGIYIFNDKIKRSPITIIIGKVDIKVDASDDSSGISHVEFYTGQIYKLLKNIDEEVPYIWYWEEKQYGWRTIKIVVYDKAGNNANEEIKVWKYF